MQFIVHVYEELYKAATSYGCEFWTTGKLTYWSTDPNQTPDLIDSLVVKNVSSNYIKIEDSVDMNSDHSPLYLTISVNIIVMYIRKNIAKTETDLVLDGI